MIEVPERQGAKQNGIPNGDATRLGTDFLSHW